MINLKIGDKVAYSVQFLKSIGESPTGDLCHCRGEIIKITNCGSIKLATIKWDNPNISDLINVGNLAKVGPNSRFCEC